MAESMTVSSSQGRVAEWHDARITTPENADKILADKNEHWIGDVNKTDADKFNEIFEDDVANFNAKQTRPSRKMGMESTNPDRQKSYYDGIVDGTFCTGSGKMKETPIYEAVLQIGNKNDNGVTDKDFDMQHWKTLKKSGHEQEASDYVLQHLSNHPNKERTKRIIHKAVERIANFDPEHLKVLRADWHEDEPCGTGHAHIAYVLKATGYKTGMESRVASVKALEQMGFKKTKESEYGIVQLHEKFKSIIEEEMIADALEYGYEAIQRTADSGEHRKHSDVDTFREMMEEQEALDSYKSELEQKEKQIKQKRISVKKEQEKLEEKEKEITKKENDIKAITRINELAVQKNTELLQANKSLKEELYVQERVIQHKQKSLEEKEHDVQGKELRIHLDADKLSKRERSISQRESEISQKESDLDNRESLLSKREENVILITEGQQRITEEQQRKADEFQHREDALQAQAYNLTKRENMLTPAGQVVDMLGIVQTTSTNPKIQEAAKLVQKYVSKNKETMDRLYPKYKKMQREQFFGDTSFDVPQQSNDYDRNF